MKKLRIISEKIESSNNNYFGRGSFETIIKNNKEIVLSWLENLTSIQNQITILNDEYECENLQKRNYVRIITKLFPQEYNQFVCINILLRDIDSITLAYLDNSDLKSQYELLVVNNRLKFPGKHKKIVDFDTYQQFITLYANDLIEKSQDFETDETLAADLLNDQNNQNENEVVSTPIVNNDANEENKIIEEDIVEIIQDKPTESKEIANEEVAKNTSDEEVDGDKTDDKTNWMNVLLKGI